MLACSRRLERVSAVIDAAAVLTERALARRDADGDAVVVGVAGSVAVGKSTLAAALGDAIASIGPSVHVLTTDAFLHSNAVLSDQGLLMRKGFPESYDLPALVAFVAAMRARSATVTVPVYSHDTYDIVKGGHDPIPASDVVVIEGVNALSALGPSLDLAVYVDAAERDIETWYLERFHRLCVAARDDERSFYRMFVDMPGEEIDAIARRTWRDVNLVNLREHIAPSRADADAVVRKGADHRVLGVDMH